MSAIDLRTELPGPRSVALGEARRHCVSSGISQPRHGLFFERADGARITDVDGNTFLDFAGGIGCLNAGHSAPRVLARAHAQLDKLQHGCFMIAPYEPYVALAQKLCEIAPIAGTTKAALFNSGAEAVENAVKIARSATGRAGVLAFDPGFHGRTLLAMTLTSKTTPYRDGFGPFAPEVYRFPIPDVLRRPRGTSAAECVTRGIADLHRFLKSTVRPERLACMLIEPVLGEGGFITPPPEFLADLAVICKEHGIVLIADEVQTGFGRTGRMFACEHSGIEPDLMCLAKSLSNGFPLSAVVGRAALMDAPPPGGLGGTFGGNPVACAAAIGAIETIEQDGLLARDRDRRDRRAALRAIRRSLRLRRRTPRHRRDARARTGQESRHHGARRRAHRTVDRARRGPRRTAALGGPLRQRAANTDAAGDDRCRVERRARCDRDLSRRGRMMRNASSHDQSTFHLDRMIPCHQEST